MKIKNFGHWFRDYLCLIHKQGQSFIYKKPPEHYLGHVVENKKPIILIPGIFEKWNFLKAIADPLSLMGHPIYILENIGYNNIKIDYASKLVLEFIEEKKLKQVIVIAHSKGGLIGKNILLSNNNSQVDKVIAIATPFNGSRIGKLIFHKAVREILPDSKIIKSLSATKDINHKIVSIFGVFDNHIWPRSSCYLDGAKNIEVEVGGHHKILFDRRVREVIVSEVGNS